MAKQYQKRDQAASAVAAASRSLVIEQPTTFSVGVEVKAKSDLIMNNFSQKAVEQMLRKHMGLTVQTEKKVPRKCIEDATTRNIKEEVCLSPTCFKKAMISAALAAKIKGLPASQLKVKVFIIGNSIPITYSAMIPRMDMVRLAGRQKVPDVRFRPQFVDWKARFIIEHSDQIAVETILDLVQRAGRCGVGEWRPTRDGTFGTFEISRVIETPEEQAEVMDISSTPIKPLIIPDWALDADIDPSLLAKIMKGEMPDEADDQSADGDDQCAEEVSA